MTIETNQPQQRAEPSARRPRPTTAGGVVQHEPARRCPDDALIIVPVRNLVLFPGMSCRSRSAGRSRSRRRRKRRAAERPIGVLLQRERRDRRPGARRPVSGRHASRSILRYVTTPDGAHHIVCQGQQRFRVLRVPRRLSVPRRARRAPRASTTTSDAGDRGAAPSAQASARSRRCSCCRRRRRSWSTPCSRVELALGQGADLVASFMDLKPEEKQEILETVRRCSARLDKVLELLGTASRC